MEKTIIVLYNIIRKMMYMNELEIIIPAYNAHSTIIKTLDSLKIQKELPDYHITIVNDFSTNYIDIINNYKEYLNIDEIITKENLGPGGARQYGIDNTESKYIVFIDSDDYFENETSIRDLYNEIEKSNADLVISNFIYERDNIRVVKEHNPVWLHGKIYRRSFLDKHNIRFNNTRANEDNGFNSLVFLLNPLVVYLNKVTYVYHENSNSITRNNNRLYKYTGLEGYAYNINWAIEEAKKKNAPERNIAIKSISGLSVMYHYYIDLYDEYDVSKILKWSKDLYINYLKYQEIADTYEQQALNLDEFKDNEKIKNSNITFNEFKEKINRLL